MENQNLYRLLRDSFSFRKVSHSKDTESRGAKLCVQQTGFYIPTYFTSKPILHPNLFYIQTYFTSKPILHPNLFYIQTYFTSKSILHPNLLYIETSFYTQTSFTCKPVLHTQWIYIQVMIVCKMLLFNRGLENPESLILRRRQFM